MSCLELGAYNDVLDAPHGLVKGGVVVAHVDHVKTAVLFPLHRHLDVMPFHMAIGHFEYWT